MQPRRLLFYMLVSTLYFELRVECLENNANFQGVNYTAAEADSETQNVTLSMNISADIQFRGGRSSGREEGYCTRLRREYLECVSLPQEKYEKKEFRVYTDKLTWDGALENCRLRHGNLAWVTSQEQQKQLEQYLNQQGEIVQIWLGATDRRRYRQFEWEGQKDLVPMSFQNWMAGEPNNGTKDPRKYLHRERCLTMKSTYQWNDLDCSRNLPYVCMESSKEYKEKHEHCKCIMKMYNRDFGQDGIKPYKKNKVFYVYYDELNWDAALEKCKSKNQKLAWITSAEDQKLLEDTLNYTGKDKTEVWIGATDRRRQGQFEWDDGEDLRPVTFTNWDVGEPNRGNKKQGVPSWVERCVQLRASYRWNNLECSVPLSYVCEDFK